MRKYFLLPCWELTGCKMSEIPFLGVAIEYCRHNCELALPRNVRTKLTTHSDTRAKNVSTRNSLIEELEEEKHSRAAEKGNAVKARKCASVLGEQILPT